MARTRTVHASTIDPTDAVRPFRRPRAFDAIVYGGVAAGVLDGLAAITTASVKDVAPVRVFQYIASGVLGRTAFGGGWRTGSLGILLHFVVAFGVATTFFAICRAHPNALRRTALVGVLYGQAVFFAMRYVVVPLSAVNQRPATLSGTLTGMLIHAFCVGLPVALIARWSVQRQ